MDWIIRNSFPMRSTTAISGDCAPRAIRWAAQHRRTRGDRRHAGRDLAADQRPGARQPPPQRPHRVARTRSGDRRVRRPAAARRLHRGGDLERRVGADAAEVRRRPGLGGRRRLAGGGARRCRRGPQDAGRRHDDVGQQAGPGQPRLPPLPAGGRRRRGHRRTQLRPDGSRAYRNAEPIVFLYDYLLSVRAPPVGSRSPRRCWRRWPRSTDRWSGRSGWPPPTPRRSGYPTGRRSSTRTAPK